MTLLLINPLHMTVLV